MQKICFLLLAGCLFAAIPAMAQTPKAQDTAYVRVVTQRAEKIVTTLGLTDAARAAEVRDIIAGQYLRLNELDAVSDTTGKAKRLQQLHNDYLAKLSARLNAQQVNQVKDGMTYGVLPLTYRVYTDMLPDLTEQQRAQIMAWLVEAREHAMDAGSSEKKHQWFGKYKGRINNYLAAAGINMKQAEQDWKKRREAGSK
ncbi:DUF3826 domain-containing protein [uncultured Chitinophaga sp.]|jgi:hypothetical protein|uniref:DUF3826 domain-containing protein n=1 Tax=uncultured Chitinophaga sp. TaxID=339340 RepID=UPI0026208C3C|nr:DUF3826 domain-containing protein [uncultured Chitinophaga sp.]